MKGYRVSWKPGVAARSVRILLAMVALANAPARASRSCYDWNTQLFFEQAKNADVARCLDSGKSLQEREGPARTRFL